MTVTPTPENRGLLPIGTVLGDVWPWTITDRSYTAYKVETISRDGHEVSDWWSFDQVHGRPAPVMPLVMLG